MNIVQLASWIREERQGQKMTQAELGSMIARQQCTISDIERCRYRDPTFEMLRRIVAALGYELSFTVTRRKP